jgi:hypothetical protein
MRSSSKEDSSPLPTGTSPHNEHAEDFEGTKQVPDQAIAQELTRGSSLRDSNKESTTSIVKPVTPRLRERRGSSENIRVSFQHELRGDSAAPFPPGTGTKTRIATTTVTTTSITTHDGTATVNTSSTTRNTTN